MINIIVAEKHIGDLADEFSTVCDGIDAATIMLAFSDILCSLSHANNVPFPEILAEFINLAGQRHQHGDDTAH